VTGLGRQRLLEPVGLVIAGLPLAEVSAGDVTELRWLLAEYGVLVLPGQELDDAGFTAFLRKFGELAFTEGETPVAGHPDLNVVSNVGRATPPRSVFHTDTSYVRHPPAYTALRAVRIPARGGETLFTNQYRAYDTLPPQVRERLSGRVIQHVRPDLDPAAESAAEHPVFRRHPISRRTALYLSTPERCVAIGGLPGEQGRPLIEFLYAHSTAPGNTYRHAWSPGDVVMWDNGCVLHRADHAGVSGDRVMHRGMVAGYAGGNR
jgi:taurine dioxygenase